MNLTMWTLVIFTAVFSITTLEAEYCEDLLDCDGSLWCCENKCVTFEDCTGTDEDTFKGLFGLGLALTIVIPLLCCCCCCGCVGVGVFCFFRSRRTKHVPGTVNSL